VKGMTNAEWRMTKGSQIELRIEELVLHGFAPGERYAIGEALERELARLLGEQGVPPSWNRDADIPRLNGGVLRVHSGARPMAVGAQVAQAIYGSLTPATASARETRFSGGPNG
jgi:hypothetical protein